MMTAHTAHPVEDASRVGEVRRTAVREAGAAGMAAQGQAEVALVVTELATNLVKHAGGGQILLRAAVDPGGPSLEILALDSGPGMGDVARCLNDRYSTAGTSGTGLGAVRRLASEFDVYSRAGRGSVVFCRMGPLPSARGSHPRFVWGAVSTPFPGEVVCGDAWSVRADGARLDLLVADGVGHGLQAAEAATASMALFGASDAAALDRFLANAHVALAGTRGAAISVASIDADGAQLRYAGVGNVTGSILAGERSIGLVSHHGTVGCHFRHAKEFVHALPPEATLVVHTDGLTTRWDLRDQPELVLHHPAVVAGVLYRDFRRGRDDATVLVVRREGAP